MADEDLQRLDAWLGQIMAGLSPAERKRAALKLGRQLRRANLARIAANVEPDGAPMERRRPRHDQRGRLRVKAGRKMFRGMRAMRNWKVDADESGLEIAPVNGLIDRIAAVSQFGEVASVGRTRDGTRIRHRFARRRLLGFSDEDETLAIEIATELLDLPVR